MLIYEASGKTITAQRHDKIVSNMAQLVHVSCKVSRKGIFYVDDLCFRK